jgi:hypothetical protein
MTQAAAPRVLVIGVLGRRMAGKTFAAEHLRRTRGASVLAFADPLKDAAVALFGLSRAQVDGDATAKETTDPRSGRTCCATSSRARCPRWTCRRASSCAAWSSASRSAAPPSS